MQILPPNIPTTIDTYSFTFPSRPAADRQDFGSSIKDLADGTDTAQKLHHAQEEHNAQAEFEAATGEYQRKWSIATARANEATLEIIEPKKQRLRAIMALATSIIANLGLAAAIVMTGKVTLLLACIAVPCIGTLLASSRKTYIFHRTVRNLQTEIDAPNLLSMPIKREVSPYTSYTDLDLKSSRYAAIDDLAHKSLQEIAESGWSKQDIVRYDLLHRATQVPVEKLPRFYARCISLLEKLDTINEKKAEKIDAVTHKFTRLHAELKEWKQGQEHQIRERKSEIQKRQEALRRLEQERNKNQAPDQAQRALIIDFDKLDIENSYKSLENYKQNFASAHGKLERDLEDWRERSIESITSKHREAIDSYEQEYESLKAASAIV